VLSKAWRIFVAMDPKQTTSREERLIDLGSEIRAKQSEEARIQSTLEQVRTEIAGLRREFDHLLSAPSGSTRPTILPADPSRPGVVRIQIPSSLSLPRKILALMQAKPGKIFRAEELAAMLGQPDEMQSIRTALARLFERDKKIARVNRGEYAVPQVPMQTELHVSQSSK
jgi:hypothetical protein